MRELSLFTGAGGGLLGTMLLRWEPVGYVEWDEYCQRVIARRIVDGYLPAAPIFTDVREFVQSGAAREYRGFANLVTAGFPCQPFSVAGKQRGANDERNMWPATLATIRDVRPRYCFLENVPAIISSGYFDHILGGLAESGYDCRWRILSAAELGAPHRRDRLWIVAHCDDSGQPAGEGKGQAGHNARRIRADVSDADRPYQRWRDEPQWQPSGRNTEPARNGASGNVANTESKGQPSTGRPFRASEKYARPTYSSWWEVEPDVGRVADGVAYRVDRLKALGNGQVPAVVAAAWEMLT